MSQADLPSIFVDVCSSSSRLSSTDIIPSDGTKLYKISLHSLSYNHILIFKPVIKLVRKYTFLVIIVKCPINSDKFCKITVREYV